MPADDDGDPHAWESAKENAAPLACGRSAKGLSKRAFGTSAADMAASEEKTRRLERLAKRCEKAAAWLQGEARTAEEAAGRDHLTDAEADALRARLAAATGFDPSASGDGSGDPDDRDPLRHWVLYVKHVREVNPADAQEQWLLAERCARCFLARPFLVPAYRDDVRLVRMCLLYADRCRRPSDVFKLMSRNKVGCERGAGGGSRGREACDPRDGTARRGRMLLRDPLH